MGLCRRRRPMDAWAPSGRLDRPCDTELRVRKVARYHPQESRPEVGSTHASVRDVPGQTVKDGPRPPREGWAASVLYPRDGPVSHYAYEERTIESRFPSKRKEAHKNNRAGLVDPAFHCGTGSSHLFSMADPACRDR